MKALLIILYILSLSLGSTAQTNTRVAFWNLENLFDTINAPATADNEFTPRGKQRWNTEKYQRKTAQIRQVISEINPAIMGVCEIENADVIKDIMPEGYRYIHYDSRDIRGVDVAMIYDPRSVKIKASEPIKPYGRQATRDLLRVEAVIDGMEIVFIVVHLPSRRGNDPKSTTQRREITHQLDSISRTTPLVVIMGDFNQNPSKALLPKLHNTTQEPYNQGKGSYAYRDVWQMYDHIFVSNALKTTARIHTRGLIQKEGRFRGYPAKGNPSDHLPVYIDL